MCENVRAHISFPFAFSKDNLSRLIIIFRCHCYPKSMSKRKLEISFSFAQEFTPVQQTSRENCESSVEYGKFSGEKSASRMQTNCAGEMRDEEG